MDIRRCGLVVGGTLASITVAWLLGIFDPGALAPGRILEGSTRSLIAVAIVLVSAMVIASSCHREETSQPIAKSRTEARNKSTA